MLTLKEAENNLLTLLPSRRIYWTVHHEGYWYILAVDESDPEEGSMNPYFKVNSTTGEVKEFFVGSNIRIFNIILEKARKKLG